MPIKKITKEIQNTLQVERNVPRRSQIHKKCEKCEANKRKSGYMVPLFSNRNADIKKKQPKTSEVLRL